MVYITIRSPKDGEEGIVPSCYNTLSKIHSFQQKILRHACQKLEKYDIYTKKKPLTKISCEIYDMSDLSVKDSQCSHYKSFHRTKSNHD